LKTERIYLVTTGLLLALVALGCQERNPAYVQKVVQNDASASPDRPADAVEAGRSDRQPVPTDGPGRETTGQGKDVESDDVATLSEAGVSGEAGVSSEAGASGEAGVSSEAGVTVDGATLDAGDAARDTREVRGPGDDARPDSIRDVAIPFEVSIDVPSPIDAGLPDLGVDIASPLDAAGVGVDSAPLCHEQDTRSCSSPGNPLLGACHAGTQTCTGGAWGVCTGEVLPAAVDLCKGLDDNCNGMIDDGCTADCVVVAPGGNDTTGDGTTGKPFATIAAAMTVANAQDGGAPRRVCVAGGATCGDANTYVMSAPLVMANGGRIQGNYALANSVLSYCSTSQPPTTVLQFASSEQGVVFDQSVTVHTELGGFVIQRYSPPNGAAVPGPISAVSVIGGVGATLGGIFVTDTPAADTTYGVDVESGGQATIVGSAITGGQGRKAAIGVYVNGGSVNLRNNCDGNPQGFCNSSCAATNTVLGIRGRTGPGASVGTPDSSAVYVTGTSPATTSMVANSLCGGAGAVANNVAGANLATLRCESGACANIAGNNIAGGSGRQTIAVNLLGGASLVDSNLIVSGCGIDSSTGVVLDGSTARLQNNRILGSQCTGSSTGTYTGVNILLGTSAGEPDLHSNDIEPMGTAGDCQSTGVAIDRSAGAVVASGILRNNIISGGNCRTRVAVDELSDSTARVVENNDLYPGPATTATDTPVLYHRGGADVLTEIQVNALAGVAKNISADPRYVVYSTNLHLLSGSPCIDRGTAEGAPATDGDGNARPAGAGFDIGAYELAAQ
jgi:hypothetical protein